MLRLAAGRGGGVAGLRLHLEREFADERLEFAELSGLHTPLDLPLIADQQLVLQDQLQELGMAQLVTGRFACLSVMPDLVIFNVTPLPE